MEPVENNVLAVMVVLGILGIAFYRCLLWLKEAPRTPDPWGEEVERSLEDDEAVPLCPHCLAPQCHEGWFCPECGSTVGPCCNYLPFVYIFSQGEVLRTGVAGSFRRSPLMVAGFFLFSLGTFALFAPVYWFFLLRNLRRHAAPEADASAV